MDILIVGAGPVGLTMAAELARHGVRSRIIDRSTAPLPYCRAIGVTPRTLEIWDDMGLARGAVDAGLWLEGLRTIVNGEVNPDARPDLSDLPFGQLGLPQYETERLLAEHLAGFGIAVERGTEFVSADITGDGALVCLKEVDGRTTSVKFSVVIGCDGAHSAVRHAAGIGFEGEAFPFDFMLGDVYIDWDMPRGLAVFSMVPREDAAPDLFIAIPLPERNRYRVSMLAPDGDGDQRNGTDHGIQAERTSPGLDALQAVADRLLPQPPRLGDLRWSSIFRISMRLADRYRAGVFFLAGDAAHIHPPTGGQGMNTGIQDAYNLAWKMALVARGEADPSLLDSYDAERRPVGADVLARTRAASERMGRDRVKEDRLADTQLLISYKGGDWIREEAAGAEGPAAGDRAPDCLGLQRQGIGAPLRLFDVLRGTRHVLLIRLDDWSRQYDIEAFACHLETEWRGLIRLVVIGPDETPPAGDFVGVPLLRDAAETYVAAYGGSAYLIRPDGHVGWKGRDWNAGLLAYFSDLLGSRG